MQEQEQIETCKIIKKPKEEIENSVQRMYYEAERRQLKYENKKNKKTDNNKINIDDFISKANLDKEVRNLTPTVFRPINNKNITKKQKYQFQVILISILKIFA